MENSDFNNSALAKAICCIICFIIGFTHPLLWLTFSAVLGGGGKDSVGNNNSFNDTNFSIYDD